MKAVEPAAQRAAANAILLKIMLANVVGRASNGIMASVSCHSASLRYDGGPTVAWASEGGTREVWRMEAMTATTTLLPRGRTPRGRRVIV